MQLWSIYTVMPIFVLFVGVSVATILLEVASGKVVAFTWTIENHSLYLTLATRLASFFSLVMYHISAFFELANFRLVRILKFRSVYQLLHTNVFQAWGNTVLRWLMVQQTKCVLPSTIGV